MSPQAGLGPESTTPRERLVARGYEIDARGRTEEAGYDGAANQQEATEHTKFQADPWQYLDELKPVLELRCAETRKMIARVWWHPIEQQHWYRSNRWQGTMLTWSDEDGRTPVACDAHGLVRVPVDWFQAEARSTRRTAAWSCTQRKAV